MPPLVSHALRGRVGGLVTASRHDSRETTAAARKAFLGRFLHEVDPEGTLETGERQRRAEAARRAYFTRLALRSASARAKARKRAKTDAPGDSPATSSWNVRG